MEPDIAYLGNDFEEAAQLQKSLLQVLDQLQSKQSPVEELLRKADELIVDQKPNAGVYSAMVIFFSKTSLNYSRLSDCEKRAECESHLTCFNLTLFDLIYLPRCISACG